jgi:bifunctional non-homologous end joining protein LigD
MSSSQAVAITNPEKVLFPAYGLTKGDLVEYYRRIASVLLPHLRERPLSLERFPNGIGSEGFFQKRASPNIPDWIDTVSLAKQNGRVRYVVCNNAQALTYLANQAVITPHT